ncbi:MAG: ABC transporter ATP-binding protein [Desulfuromonas sp.]|nr:ABC transporter ATP-binding protein [Desulfuromonas sp.]
MAEAILTATALQKCYCGQSSPAVNGLDLMLGKGELLALLGPNGAGKTTTLSLLSTLMRPDSGTLTIDGVDALKHAEQVRHLMGVVPQDLALYPTLTLHENLNFWGRLYGLRGRSLQQRVDECIQFTALEGVLSHRIDTFSGGMKRRANLAAGILHQPQILFLDEPTVGIDAQSRHLILTNLRQLNAQGMSMIYTSHYMEEVSQLCQRLVVMDEGVWVAEGSVEQLLAEHPDCDHLEELFLKLTGKQLRD